MLAHLAKTRLGFGLLAVSRNPKQQCFAGALNMRTSACTVDAMSQSGQGALQKAS